MSKSVDLIQCVGKNLLKGIRFELQPTVEPIVAMKNEGEIENGSLVEEEVGEAHDLFRGFFLEEEQGAFEMSTSKSILLLDIVGRRTDNLS